MTNRRFYVEQLKAAMGRPTYWSPITEGLKDWKFAYEVWARMAIRNPEMAFRVTEATLH